MGVDDAFPQTYDYLKSKDQLKREQEFLLKLKLEEREREREQESRLKSKLNKDAEKNKG